MLTKNTYLFGRQIEKKYWNSAEMREIGLRAERAAVSMRSVSRDYIISLLAETGKLFTDGKSPYRREALKHLRASIPFSPKMTAESLDMIGGMLSRRELYKRMNLELFLPFALETPIERRGYDGLLKAVPRGVALHVGAGNVFLGLVDSLVLGILTKNANIVKMPSGGSHFITLFMEALKECDGKGIVSSSVAALSWKGGREDLEKEILAHSDTVFVWGGEEAVLSYRRKSPVNARVVGFGPKTSMGIVFESGIQNAGYGPLSAGIAKDVSMWDQSACSCLHTLYFFDKNIKKAEKRAKEFIPFLKKAFSDFQKKLPQGKLTDDEKVEITKARELAVADEALGDGFAVSSFPEPHWTVIFEKKPFYRVSPLNRVLYIKAVSSFEELRKNIRPYKGYIQTVGVAGGTSERKRVLSELSGMGIARVVNSGKMLEGAAGSPHDGIFPMMQLIDWVGIEERPSQLDRLVDLVSYARKKSSFYRRHYRKAPEIKTLRDFEKLPFLVKDHIYENTPPESSAMLTGRVERGVYFASGGSTGSPKYIFYDWHEYDQTARLLAYTLEAAGLDENDRIANLFVAGNLWSSWITVEKALSYTKAISVPVGSALPVENIAAYLRDFEVSAVIGLPSFLVRLAEYACANRKKLNLKVRKIFYGGEYVGDEMVKFFRKCFPGASVRSAGFATADGGVIGFQCPHCRRGEHHLFDNTQYIEFVDPETLKPVRKGETGELVITSLTKRKMPIIRFRLGDLGRWVPRKCECSRGEPLFEVLGRADDRIHAGGAHLFVSDIQNAVGKVPELSFNFQILIEKKGPRDILTLAVEVKREKDMAKAREIEKKLRKEIYAHCADLYESVKMKWIDEPEIALLKPNMIERVRRTGKIRRVIDKRIVKR